MSIKLPRSLNHSITALACASCGKLTTLLAVGTATGQIAVWLLKNTVTASSSSSSSPKRSSPKSSSDAPILFRLLDQCRAVLHVSLTYSNQHVRRYAYTSGCLDAWQGSRLSVRTRSTNSVQYRTASYTLNVPRNERCAIVSLQLGSSSSGSLLTLDARGSAKLYSLEVPNSNETSSKGTYTPQVPQLLLTVCADDLKRPLLQRELAQWATGTTANTTAQSSTKKGAAEAVAADGASPAWLTRCNSTAVVTAALHPALTLTGAQLSLVVGTEVGTVVKCNADAWNAAQQRACCALSGASYASTAVGISSLNSASSSGLAVPIVAATSTTQSAPSAAAVAAARAEVVYGPCLVNTEPAQPTAIGEALNNVLFAGRSTGQGNACKREFFEHHRTALLYSGFTAQQLCMITLDSSLKLALWQYPTSTGTTSNVSSSASESDSATAFAWYAPTAQAALDLTYHTYVPIAGGTEQLVFEYNSCAQPPARTAKRTAAATAVKRSRSADSDSDEFSDDVSDDVSDNDSYSAHSTRDNAAADAASASAAVAAVRARALAAAVAMLSGPEIHTQYQRESINQSASYKRGCIAAKLLLKVFVMVLQLVVVAPLIHMMSLCAAAPTAHNRSSRGGYTDVYIPLKHGRHDEANTVMVCYAAYTATGCLDTITLRSCQLCKAPQGVLLSAFAIRMLAYLLVSPSRKHAHFKLAFINAQHVKITNCTCSYSRTMQSNSAIQLTRVHLVHICMCGTLFTEQHFLQHGRLLQTAPSTSRAELALLVLYSGKPRLAAAAAAEAAATSALLKN
eukprot:7847-Heterococcus_DN1.PRE.2